MENIFDFLIITTDTVNSNINFHNHKITGTLTLGISLEVNALSLK